jgi:hypothetical protein
MEYNPKKEFSFFLQLADLKDPLDLTLIPSNPNFDADIAFLCDSIEDFLTLSPIVKAMPEAEFVFFYRSYSKDPKERINLLIEANYLLKLASKDNLYCRLYYLDNRIEQSLKEEDHSPSRLYYLDNRIEQSLKEEDHSPSRLYYLDNRIEQSMLYEFFMELRTMFNFFEKYKILVGAKPWGPLSFVPLTHKKKLLFCENPLEWMNVRNFSHIDFFAATGPYPASLFSVFGPSRIVGSPRLEVMFNSVPLKNPASGKIDSILYLPSKSNLLLKENINILLDALPEQIQLKIFIPYFRALSRHIWNQSAAIPEIEVFFYGDKDPAEIIASSDVVIIEDPTYLIECLLFEKPIILFDRVFKENAYFDMEHIFLPQQDSKSFGISDPTISDIGLILKDPTNLEEAFKIIEEGTAVLETLQSLNKIKEAFISFPKENSLKESIRFIREAKNMPRPRESFLSRIWKYEELLRYSNIYLQQRFGVKYPLGDLALKIFRIVSELEEYKNL